MILLKVSLRPPLEKFAFGLFLLCVAMLAYYIFKNILGTYHTIPERLAFVPANALSSPKLTGGIILLFLGLGSALFSTKSTSLFSTSFWFMLSGAFAFFAMLLALLGALEPRFHEVLAFLLFALLLLYGCFFLRPSPPKLKATISPIFIFSLLPSAYLLALRTFEHLVNAAFLKTKATGDEIEFWFSATEHFNTHGFIDYFTKVNGGYDPGYVFFNIPFLKISGLMFPSPYFLAPILMFMITLRVYVRKSLEMNTLSLALWTTCFAGLFLYHDWLNVLLFQAWYGEALALLATYWLFEIIQSSETKQKLAPLDFLALFFFGFASPLIKPPMSFLLLPCVLPTFFVAGIFLRKNKNYFYAIGMLFFAALLAKVSWKLILLHFEAKSYYSVTLSELTNLRLLDGSLPLAIKYLIANYKPIWIPFFLLAPAALAIDLKRHLPATLVTIGLVLSIALLYATRFSGIEHESSGRYLIQSLMPWYLFTLPEICKWGAVKLKSMPYPNILRLGVR